jgi:hypothetical protein
MKMKRGQIMETTTYDTRTRLHRAYLVYLKLKRSFVDVMNAPILPESAAKMLRAYLYKGRHHVDSTKKQVTRILDATGKDTGERMTLAEARPQGPSLSERIREVRAQRRLRRDVDRVWHLPTGEYEAVEEPGWIMRERTLQRAAEAYQ